MITITYCEICKSLLEEKGAIHEIYERICESYIKNSEFQMPFLIDSENSDFKTMVDFLESSGYVVTTEYDCRMIAIKPLGVESRDREYLICPCSGHIG